MTLYGFIVNHKKN